MIRAGDNKLLIAGGVRAKILVLLSEELLVGGLTLKLPASFSKWLVTEKQTAVLDSWWSGHHY